jgi:ABC-type multidrug transport system fused ATPase/permease subunit
MKFRPLFRLIQQSPGLRLIAIFGGFLAVLEAVAAPVQAHILRYLIDGILQGDTDSFWHLAIAGVAVMFAMAVIAWIRSWVMGRFSEGGAADLRDKAVESILEMPVPKLDSIHTGDHLSRLTNDTGVVRHYLYFELFWLISLPLAGVLGLAYLLYIDWIMTLVTLAMIPIFIFLTTKVSAPIAKISSQLQEKLAEVNNVTQDALGGAEVVRAFNLQGEMERRNDGNLAQTVISGLSLARQQALVRMASVMAGFLPFLLPLVLGGWFAITGRISTGSLIGFVQMLNSVTNPMAQLPVALGGHQKAMAALERIYQLIDEPRERHDGEEFASGQELILEAENLIFGYENGTVLNGMSFELRKGETVALVGPSGAGKSTVFKVLTGFYPPESGEVRLFHQPLEKWNLAAARRQMAMVSQDTFLFPGTIAENLALGKPDASREEIIAAAIQANAHEFIQQQPQGYDHVLTERGANLSGGQRQRLAIARAIVLDAPLLLLDEATSALDTESERLVQDALEKIAASRTTLVIAHRLSTIRDADRIVVLAKGKVTEEGNHQELLERGGLYKRLHDMQFDEELQNTG